MEGGSDMKKYNIRNKRKKAVAYLLYDEKKKSFLIEIPKDSKLEELPMILRASASRGIFQMDEKNSRRWVQDRIVSPNRQNIGQILRRANLKSFDEMALLQRCEGRSIQDDFYID